MLSHNIFTMLQNYLKIALRNLLKNKLHSTINISGLALGMAAATLLLLNIHYGLSIDQFHQKKTRLFEAYTKGNINGGTYCWNLTAGPLAPALAKYPEITNIARTAGTNNIFTIADKKIAAGGTIVDPAFLSMFSFPLLQGNPATALQNPNDIVLTQKLATRIFGTQNPINQTLSTPTGENFTVTAILQDIPSNTQFHFEYLLSWTWLRGPGSWKSQNVNTFVELAPNATLAEVNKKIANVASDNKTLDPSQSSWTTFLYPLTKVYLENRFENGIPAGGNIDSLRIQAGLAAIILLIACINFMNLSTARSEKRAKEVGIRKVVGAARRSLIAQFIAESILMATLAGVIALSFVQIAIPYFNTLTGIQLSLPWHSPSFSITIIGFILITGLLAGSYPAFYLSSFKPIKVLKGILNNRNALVTPRKVLVITQFVFSIFLINFSVVLQRQLTYETDREIGFAKEDLVYHPLTADLKKNFQAVKNELIATGAATSVCESSALVTQIASEESGLKWDGMDPKANPAFVLLFENGDFIHTNGLQLLEGRDIDIEKYPGDTLSCVINEASVKTLGFKQPVGQIIHDEEERWKIVGVVKNFLVGEADQNYSPVLIKGGVGKGYIDIRINKEGSVAQNIRQSEAILKKYNPAFITDLQFADKDYEQKFRQTKNTAFVINTFTIIAIFISCMGLLGLASYMAEKRTREIGIRKVLGASITSIVSLLSKDFVKLIAIAILIASPAAWLFMQSWLQRFSYRVPLSANILFISGFAALATALATISFQVLRAAIQNPVKNLRTD